MDMSELKLPACARILRLVLSFCISISLVGCIICERVDGFAKVQDIGQTIKTKYRYRINECRVNAFKDGKDNKNHAVWLLNRLRKATLELQPDVFAADGFPIVVLESRHAEYFDMAVWSYPLYLVSFSIFPLVQYHSCTNAFGIEIANLGVKSGTTECGFHGKTSTGSLVIALAGFAKFFWMDPPDRSGNENEYLTWEYVAETAPGEHRSWHAGDRARVYAIAALLKKMEDSGEIDAALAKIAEQKREADRLREAEEERLRLRQEARKSIQMAKSGVAGKPPYRIIKLKREEGSDFAYSFELGLMENASIQTFFGVQNVFANEVLVAYTMEYPNANSHTLRVSVHPRLEDGRIVGRAEVLTITPTSLSYDAGTRCGKLSVRFNPGQAEEARAWVRKNIETLAQDKNIALTTGQLPPAATYYSLGERIDGNVMEIEFKTE